MLPAPFNWKTPGNSKTSIKRIIIILWIHNQKPKCPSYTWLWFCENGRRGERINGALQGDSAYRPCLDILGLTDVECIQPFIWTAKPSFNCASSSQTNRPHALPVIIKVTTALSVLASGSFQRVTGACIPSFCVKVFDTVLWRNAAPHQPVHPHASWKWQSLLKGTPGWWVKVMTIIIYFHSIYHYTNSKVVCTGDRGYPWLMTLFHNSATESLGRYNQVHAVIRSVIEYTFGVLKSGFRCLDESGGCLPLNPEKVCHGTNLHKTHFAAQNCTLMGST